MSQYYRLKTARPLPDTLIPLRITQPRPGLTSVVDECTGWRSEPMFTDNKVLIWADTESVDGDESVYVDPEWAGETVTVEIDLEDPIVALQLLRRYRELFGIWSNRDSQSIILGGLLADDEDNIELRVEHIERLLLELDVPAADAAKES